MKLFCAVCLSAVLLLATACKDTPYPIDDPVVRLQGDVSQRIIGAVGTSSDTTRVDSLSLSSVKVLVRQVRLHRERAESTAYDVLIAPPVVVSSPDATVYSSVFPVGNYDGAAFELTRLTDAEASQYAADARFADFVTASRPSFVVEGKRQKQGIWTNFRLEADTATTVSNLLDSPLGIPKGSETDLFLLLNVPQFAMSGKDIVDPLAKGNSKVLEARFVGALRIAKKAW